MCKGDDDQIRCGIYRRFASGEIEEWIMDKKTKEYHIRTLETECKNYYKTKSEEAKKHYEFTKKKCLDLNILSEEQIKELEDHMKEQHGKRDCKK